MTTNAFLIAGVCMNMIDGFDMLSAASAVATVLLCGSVHHNVLFMYFVRLQLVVAQVIAQPTQRIM